MTCARPVSKVCSVAGFQVLPGALGSVFENLVTMPSCPIVVLDGDWFASAGRAVRVKEPAAHHEQSRRQHKSALTTVKSLARQPGTDLRSRVS